MLYPCSIRSVQISAFLMCFDMLFRSIWALLTALIVSIIIGPRFIAWLQRLKFGQFIHEDVKKHMPIKQGLLLWEAS